jgi:hypothetical protein
MKAESTGTVPRSISQLVTTVTPTVKGPGNRNMNKNQRHAAGLYVRARFCSYAFLSKRIWVNMKYNRWLKNKIQPVVEATSYKRQATSCLTLDVG